MFYVEAHEHYQKGGFRNRCQIAGPNGVQLLSVPLEKGKNSKMPIKEVKIYQTENWQKIHWDSIQTAYGKSPFFEYYEAEIQAIFFKKWTFLFDLNLELTQLFIELMQISTKLKFTDSYAKTPPASSFDYRNKLRPNQIAQNTMQTKPYGQVFEAKNGFLANLSILDLLFCTGPEALFYLE